MSTTKTILKNTIFLYIRMIITMMISLFTSRVIINALGFTDYGIYSVVGGIVGLISFMHASLAGATIRFMNVQMGSYNLQDLKSVFNSAVIVHLCLALLILIVGESLGLWYFYNKLNIPSNREVAAMWVFQFSIVSVIMTILQTPYDAAIVAHQKMSIYAYISILEALLKLLIALAVFYSPYDRLIVYSGLLLFVSTIVRLIYQIYCRLNFEECRFSWQINKEYVKSISAFFGWDVFGNFSIVLKNQGIQLVINFFFGVIYNTVAGIATTVSGILQGLASNFSIAVKPQITQFYAQGKIDEMFRLTYLNARLTFYVLLLISMPVFVDGNFILSLWLKNVPPYTYLFSVLILIQIVLSRLHAALNDVIQASGKISRWSFIGGLVNVFNVLLTYILLIFFKRPEIAYLTGIICIIPSMLINIYYTKLIFPRFSIKSFLYHVYLKALIVAFLGGLSCILMILFLPNSTFFSFIKLFTSFFMTFGFIWIIGINNDEKSLLLKKFRA